MRLRLSHLPAFSEQIEADLLTASHSGSFQDHLTRAALPPRVVPGIASLPVDTALAIAILALPRPVA